MGLESWGDRSVPVLSTAEVAELAADTRLAELAVAEGASDGQELLDELVRQRLAARRYKEERAAEQREADLRVVRNAPLTDAAVSAAVDRLMEAGRHPGPPAPLGDSLDASL